MKKIIILGTAHLATTPGKRSPDGKFREYAFSREIVTMLKAKLQAFGYEVFVDYMATEPNAYMKATSAKTEQSRELIYRVKQVNDLCKKYGSKNCLYVSIHVNAAKSDGKWHDASGFTVFVSKNASDNSKRLAKLFTSLALERELTGNRSIPRDKFWSANLYVLKNTYCPAVLTENFFQDNKKDVEFLMSDEGHNEIVKLHLDAIQKYCNSL